jgi:hypothetical protein
MSRRTRDVRSEASSYPVDLREAIARFLPRSGLGLLKGNGKLRWVMRMVVVAAILTTWGSAAAITDRFESAWRVVRAMWTGRRQPGCTYGGFIKTLRKSTAGLLKIIIPVLRAHTRRVACSVKGKSTCWTLGRWVVFGVDGSRVECPMTADNEKAFGTAGKNRTGPQQFLTTMFHVASGLIWDYRRGDARSSERGHLLEMLDALPAQAMVLADAGFTGYDVFKTILNGGRSLLIRVGSNVSLLRNLGWGCENDKDMVYLWPEKKQKTNKPPLTLRLITVPLACGKQMHLLTNVMDRTQLSDEQAAAMYHKRWTIELMYRSLKQTMGRRRMRCQASANAAVELDWAVIGLWMLGLMSVNRLIEAGHDGLQWSVATSLRVVRRAMDGCVPRPQRRRQPSLALGLAGARKDHYQRKCSKKSRHWPHKKREIPPGVPKARNATAIEIESAAALRRQKIPA